MKRSFLLCICLCCMCCLHSKATENTYEVNTQVLGEDQKPIVGALFSLYKNGNLYTDMITSDSIGNVKIRNITSGTYILRQDSSMYGYHVADAPIGFTIDTATKQNMQIKAMKNKRIYGNVRIQLEDEKKKPLTSFPISIFNKDGMVIKKIKSDEKGYVNLQELAVGEYKIYYENKFRKQKNTSFSITPYNSNTQYRISLHLNRASSRESIENYTFVGIFVIMVVTGISFLIYFIRKRTFTQFLDDFMV